MVLVCKLKIYFHICWVWMKSVSAFEALVILHLPVETTRGWTLELSPLEGQSAAFSRLLCNNTIHNHPLKSNSGHILHITPSLVIYIFYSLTLIILKHCERINSSTHQPNRVTKRQKLLVLINLLPLICYFKMFL